MIPTPPVPQELLDTLQNHEEFLIIGHKNPDSDCLNSQLAMGAVLQMLGKQYHLISPGPFERHEIKHLATQFSVEIPEHILERRPVIIVVDCSTLDRIAPFDRIIDGLTTIVIDHHASGEPFGNISYNVPRAFSVTFLIYHIIKALDLPLTQELAQTLLFGLATDTGYFRHINGGRSEVFSMIAELAEAGANPATIHHQMYGDRSFRSRQLLGLLLSRTEQLYGGKLLFTWETLEEHMLFGEKERDSETLYAQLLSVEGCDVAVYLRQEAEKSCTIGFRTSSQSSIDVGLIASNLGGGGHRKASGTTLQMNFDKAKATVIGILEFYLGE